MKNINFIEARKSQGWTQEQLAKELGLSGKSTVSNWENGYSKPRLEIAFKVANILNRDIDYLFGYKVQESCFMDV